MGQGIYDRREGTVRIEYYEYGEPYFGSDGGMNYRVVREPLENVHFIPPEKRPAGVLRASAWRGPWNFAVTPEKEIQTKEFAFTEEGLQGSHRLAQRRTGENTMNLEELINEAGQAAGDIGNAVSEAVRTGNFSHLSGDVEQSVSG